MNANDSSKYIDFCHFIQGRTSFDPWLDGYNATDEDYFCFVHCGNEDNGRFGNGDIELQFDSPNFSYQDVADKLKEYYRNNCKGLTDLDDSEDNFVLDVEDLHMAIKAWIRKDKAGDDVDEAVKVLMKNHFIVK